MSSAINIIFISLLLACICVYTLQQVITFHDELSKCEFRRNEAERVKNTHCSLAKYRQGMDNEFLRCEHARKVAATKDWTCAYTNWLKNCLPNRITEIMLEYYIPSFVIIATVTIAAIWILTAAFVDVRKHENGLPCLHYSNNNNREMQLAWNDDRNKMIEYAPLRGNYGSYQYPDRRYSNSYVSYYPEDYVPID